MTEITLRDGSVAYDPRLGRIKDPNPEAYAKYPIRGILGATQQAIKSRTWGTKDPLDQGREGACVGFTWTAELMSNPYAVAGCGQDTARPLYYELQRRDRFDGGEYPGASPKMAGTSVEEGAKLLMEAGHYWEYRWARTEQDVALAVGYKGPVVIGVDWYEGMHDVDRDGFIEPTGDVLGGHCTLIYGLDARAGHYKILNSWGKRWGMAGTCKLRREHLAELLRQDGEACLPVRRRKPQYALAL